MNARGAALAEVVVSILLVAISVSGLMEAVLTAGGQAGRAEDAEAASVALSGVLQELRNYVTDAPEPADAGWRLPGDSCGCWALDESRAHDVTARLPEDFRRAHPEARLTYTVAVAADDTRRVDAKLDWDPR